MTCRSRRCTDVGNVDMGRDGGSCLSSHSARHLAGLRDRCLINADYGGTECCFQYLVSSQWTDFLIYSP